MADLNIFENWATLFGTGANITPEPANPIAWVLNQGALYNENSVALSRAPVPTVKAESSRMTADMIDQLINRYKDELSTTIRDVPSGTKGSNRDRLKFLHNKATDSAFKFLLNEEPSQLTDTFQKINERFRGAHLKNIPPIFDLSGIDTIRVAVDEELATCATDTTGSAAVQKQIKWAYDEYISLGEKLLRSHEVMLADANKLDKIADKIHLILSLDDNAASDAMFASFEQYISEAYKTVDIDKKWKEFCELMARREYVRQLLDLPFDVSQAGDAPLCSVCIIQPVSHVIIGCGHTFCEQCCSRSTKCMICRGTAGRKQKLFFS